MLYVELEHDIWNLVDKYSNFIGKCAFFHLKATVGNIGPIFQRPYTTEF